MKATLAGVAKRAGVSKATASRVLNKKMVMPIPQATIERIERAAQELDYRPNALARALTTRRTYSLGLFTQEMTDPHFARMLEAIETKARALGYHILICGEIEGVWDDGRVDGVLLLNTPDNVALTAPIKNLPALFLWQAAQPIPNCVAWSDFQGAYQAGEYLIGLGHRHVGAIFGDMQGTEASLQAEVLPPKVAGFRQAIREGGGHCRELRTRLSLDQFENGYLLTRQLLTEDRDVTAVFTRNDFLALGAMRALREAGIRIPQEVSVIGYNDTDFARCADPELTSVHTPGEKAGTIAVEQLVYAIEGDEKTFPGIVLPTSLTIRASCAAVR